MAKRISFNSISFGYNKGKPLLFRDLNFSIEAPNKKEGYIVGLMGDSGCGKSTLLKLILGIENPCPPGKVDTEPKMPIISYLPQEPVLFEHLSPLENAMYFSKTKRYKRYFDKTRFKRLEKLLDMEDPLESAKSINDLSGGQKQRISLLRALSINPDILLLDEPLTGLDEKIKHGFLVDLARLAQECKILMIYVTHYRQEIELISDMIVYLKTEKEKVKEIVKGNEIEKEYKYVHDVIQCNTSVFFSKPPTLSALYLSKAYEMNVLPVKIDSQGNMSLYNKDNIDETDCCHISFCQDVIRFDADMGWEFTVKAQTNSYLYLQLTNGSVVIFPVAKKDEMDGKNKILLNGSVDVYLNENYQATKTINNNKV